ncbi:MAG: hypothetical protein ABL940_09225 [Bacteroidia bacterium]
MNKLYLLALTLLHSALLHAQVQHEQLTQGITIKGTAGYGANFLNNQQASVFNTQVLNLNTPIAFKQNNRVGVELNAGVYYTTKLKRNINYIIGVGTTTLINAKLSTDAANILSYGNYNYQGKQANLDNSFLQQYSMQYVQLGIVLHSPDSATQLQITGNVLGVKKYTEANIHYLEMNTTPYFTSIYGQGNYNAIVSDTSANANQFAHYSGAGGVLNLDASSTITHSFATKAYYGLRNVGGIKLNKRAISLNKTGSFLYDGVTINGIADLRDTNLINTTIQNLKDSLYSLHTGTYSTMLPWNMYVAFDSKLYKNWNAHYGLNYQYSVGYMPMFFAQVGQNYKHVSWAVVNTYGGYSGYGLGINASVTTNQFELYLGVKNLLLLSKNKVNQGVQFGINVPLNY